MPIENGEFKEKSFIIIFNDNMRENMKKNSVHSFHFDCTYKWVLPTSNKYRLLVLSGYDNLGNSIMLFYSLLRWKKKFLKVFLMF